MALWSVPFREYLIGANPTRGEGGHYTITFGRGPLTIDQLSYVIRGSKGPFRPSGHRAAWPRGRGGFYYHVGPGHTGCGRMSSYE